MLELSAGLPQSAVPSPPDTAQPSIMRPNEAELVAWAESLYEEAAQARKQNGHDAQWDDWLKGFWGELWPSDLPSFKIPIVANEMQSLILQEVSDLTDSPISVYVQHDVEQKSTREEGRERAIRGFWRRQQIDQKLMLACLDAMILPCGYLTCTWNPRKLRGLGDVEVSVRHPKTVYPDPDCEDDENMRYIILRDVMDLVEIRALWTQGWRVQPEARWSITLDDPMADRRSGRYRGPIYAPGHGLIAQGWAKARAAVLTVIIQDDSLIEDVKEITDPMTGERQLKSNVRREFPNGRMLQVSGGVVLYDGPLPYWGPWPLIRITMLPAIHSFFPRQSPASQVIEIQRASNKLESQVVENAIRLNNGVIIADTTSGVSPSTYAGIPGQPILKNPNGSVTISYPPPMPADMVNAGDRLRGVMRELMGFPPSRLGQGQRGNVSAELTETEISQSMSISRLRGRMLFHAAQNLVDMIFARMAQFYTYRRVLPYVTGSDFQTQMWEPMTEQEYFCHSVHLDPSSFEVRSRNMMQRLYLTLAKMGKIPDQDLLTTLEIPNAAAIGARLKEQLVLAAQAKGHMNPEKK